ncbi:metallophosphoesterase [Methylorubrum populi]|uniref:metallophosphoesterase family protein n=1 Tax=Methylorubrum populi TaxID=223967 RepID=UPI003F65A045
MTVVRRLWVFSDLHQEWPANAWDPDPAANAPSRGFDVAVVAGDVHVPLTKSLDWLAERLTGVPVVYVPGNHDFWWDRGDERYTIHDQLERGRERVAAHGIHLLLDKAVAIGGTRFLCGTLWTDFRLGSFGLTHAFRSAQGRFGMMDYPNILNVAATRAKENLYVVGSRSAWQDAGVFRHLATRLPAGTEALEQI